MHPAPADAVPYAADGWCIARTPDGYTVVPYGPQGPCFSQDDVVHGTYTQALARMQEDRAAWEWTVVLLMSEAGPVEHRRMVPRVAPRGHVWTEWPAPIFVARDPIDI